MELKNYEKQLQILTAKTLDLQKRVKEKMNGQRFSFCRYCSSHGRYCVVADCSPDERERERDRERLIAITDSLNTLILSLQTANQKRESEEALGRIEESRKMVRERAKLFSEKERESGGVIADLIAFLGESLWEMEEEEKKKKKKSSVNGIYRFLVGTARFGLEFLVVFATIYASLEFARISSGKQHKDHHQDVSGASRIQQQQPRFLLTNDDADVISLDVLCGRG